MYLRYSNKAKFYKNFLEKTSISNWSLFLDTTTICFLLEKSTKNNIIKYVLHHVEIITISGKVFLLVANQVCTC